MTIRADVRKQPSPDPKTTFLPRAYVLFARWCDESKLTQLQLAEKLAITQPQVSMLRRRLNFPGPRVIAAVDVGTNGVVRPGDWYVPATHDEEREYRKRVPAAR